MQDAADNELPRTSQKAQRVTAHSRKLAAKTGSIPHRVDFDPIAIPEVLPSVFLIERLEENTYRFRLQGTEFADRGVSDMTGLKLQRDATQAGQRPIFGLLDRDLDTPCGLHFLGVEQSEQGRQSLVEYVALPLLDSEGAVRYIVGNASPLATLGYDDEETVVEGPLIEVREIREISVKDTESKIA